jgi:hydrogenase maturation protein HypF
MLPYTPLHSLLLAAGRPALLVMTSGNASAYPIVADDREAVERLGPMVDGLLVHDRPIVNRCDDSVGFVEEGRLVLIRRSRGFVPLPVRVDRELTPTLAVGAMLSAVFALARGRRVFLSQHIGDADNLETLDFLGEAVRNLGRLVRIEPEIVAHDMHPDLPTTRWAGEMAGDARTVAVQHHHAHLVSAMAASGLKDECQGLALDGTGWGPDGTIWGGEILVGSASGYRRAGHLRGLPLPGGEAAIRRPIRTAVAYLHVLVPGARERPLDLWRRARPDEVEVVRRLVDAGANTPVTSSAGRLFDAVSSLLNVCDEVTYEGQAAIELEHLARIGRVPRSLDLQVDVVDEGEEIVLDPAPLLAGLVGGVASGTRPADLAAGFHAALAAALAECCARVKERGGPEVVVLCGGVYQNRILTRMTQKELRRRGLVPVPPAAIPVGDGGLALGQVLIANARQG